MSRLFVAAWPTSDVSRRLAEIDRPSEAGVRWVPSPNWHITLRFIGDADAESVAERLAGATLPRSLAVMGPTIEPLGKRQIVVPVDGVDALAGAVRAATIGIGAADRHDFRGHLTIARLKPSARPSAVGEPFRAEFEIDDVALVSSELGAAGAVYTTLARFPTA